MNVAQPLVQASLLGEAIDRGPLLVFLADEEMRLVAVNQTACDLLGYGREELLGLRVTDVACYPEAAGEFAELVAGGERTGVAHLARKDGGTLRMEYRAAKTTVARMTLYVSVGWPADRRGRGRRA